MSLHSAHGGGYRCFECVKAYSKSEERIKATRERLNAKYAQDPGYREQVKAKAREYEAKRRQQEADDPRKRENRLRAKRERQRRIRARWVAKGLTTNGTPWTIRRHDPEQSALIRWLRAPKVSATVARLVWRQQMDYWRQHPEEKRDMRRAAVSAQARLDYWRHPHIALRNREKSKRRKAQKRRLSLVVQVSDRDLRARLILEFGGQCAYCQRDISVKTLELEHFIPISKGGTHTLGNLLPACFECNRGPDGKWDSDPEEWYKAQPFYSEARWRKILKVLGLKTKQVGQLSLV